jgi:sec-independent protein translocase protein TatA
MFGLGLPEIALIVLGLAILFFGGRKISEFANSMGRLSGEFKKGRAEMERELKNMQDTVSEIKKDTRQS